MQYMVVAVRQNLIRRLELNLELQGWVNYSPRYRCVRTLRELALFPSYTFVEVRGCMDALWGTRGVAQCLGTCPRADAEIARLRAAEDADGLVQVRSRELVGARARGTRLRVDAPFSPFDGQLCVYQEMSGHERDLVVLSLMGHEVPVEVRSEDLVAA